MRPPRGSSGKRTFHETVRQTVSRGGGKEAGDNRKEVYLQLPPNPTEWQKSSQLEHLPKQPDGQSPLGLAPQERQLDTLVKKQLETIHPHPGPRREKTNKSDEMRRRRRERRYGERRRRRDIRHQHQIAPKRRREGRLEIITWNVQSVSLRENNRRRFRRILEVIEKKKWQVTLLTEIKAQTRGVLWFGEDQNRMAVIHSERTAIVLSGEMMDRWIASNQIKKFSERSTTVIIDGLKFMSIYQPLWSNGREGIEVFRRELEGEIACSHNKQVLIMGGDFNSQVGRGPQQNRVKGPYGLNTPTNEAGEDLTAWCEENGLSYLNSFSAHTRRGTWYNIPRRKWYELDGFVTKQEHRHKIIEKMWTIEEKTLSDHKPVGVRIKTYLRKWRGQGGRKENREETKINYEERTREKMRERSDEIKEDGTNWKILTEVMVGAAEEVCGRKTRDIANPWTIGYEEELAVLSLEIEAWIDRRNELLSVMRTRHQRRLREVELNRVRNNIKEARKNMKRRLRQLEREWWEEIIVECNEASRSGNIGGMYKALRKLGQRGRKEQEGNTITTDQFKTHFQNVSKDRYEEDPQQIEEATQKVKDLRQSNEAREANILLNMTPSEEEIKKEMAKVKDSDPGKDGVRMSYISAASEEVKQKIIRMVQYMFEHRAHRWEEDLRQGQMVPIYKKRNKNDPNNYRGVCLLAMGSRLLGRVVATRLRGWSENLGLTDDNQCGFRPGRSTTDATQVFIRIEEDTEDLRRRRGRTGAALDTEYDPVARLLDLRKAYPRVSKLAL